MRLWLWLVYVLLLVVVQGAVRTANLLDRKEKNNDKREQAIQLQEGDRQEKTHQPSRQGNMFVLLVGKIFDRKQSNPRGFVVAANRPADLRGCPASLAWKFDDDMGMEWVEVRIAGGVVRVTRTKEATAAVLLTFLSQKTIDYRRLPASASATAHRHTQVPRCRQALGLACASARHSGSCSAYVMNRTFTSQ